MEHKLSAKATKIRHRLTFARSSSARGLAVTLASPTETNPSSSRPRSATYPESPTHSEPTWAFKDPDHSQGYSFTDEPGYFRPVSPLIDRQEIEEDLEDDIKHACAMLSHSIDRGIPTVLPHRSAGPVWTIAQNQPSVEAAPLSLEQHANLLSAPKPISPETENTEKHDSGVGMSFNSPSQPGRPYENSVSGKNSSARFYNKQSSASPPHSPSAGPYSRSLSPATTVEEDGQRKRAYSSSPVPFQYSPPQLNSVWRSEPMTLDSPISPLSETDSQPERAESGLETESQTASADRNNNKPKTFLPAISPPLGGVDRTWLRATGDIQRQFEEATTQPKETKPVIRFYSSYNQTTDDFNPREWPMKNFWDRDPSIHSEGSLASRLSAGMGTMSRPETADPRLGTTSTNEEALPVRYPYHTFAGSSRGMSYSSSCLGNEIKNQGRVYSVDVPDLPPKNNRRKKASLLFRKLAGLGMKKK
ncbi:hypothetical protein PENCOP_c006G08804 [Penicillium coprophilum]|uniref:Uncharacterized protein n=1 Tax=Penicillium coprophilum TaxID=36646 RepID=A0A1V6UNW3_9EURO|nr:hypothetical protein PENCOP_c006G08804 [Penicillium coprophilum]